MSTNSSDSEEELDYNVFASPWKESDVVLVVEETEFHVHRSILALQSPVFKTMFNGNFKEASQEKITLEGKDPEDMLQFLKLLYPQNMIKAPLVSFMDENVFKMLALADEYQAEDVMKQCLKESEITPENAFKIRRYAVKYDESICEQCDEVIKRNIATSKIEKELSALPDKELLVELLVARCHFLESIVVEAYDLLKYILEKALGSSASSLNLNSDYCCGHKVCVSDFKTARKCQHCLRAYKKSFIDKVLTREYGYQNKNQNRQDKLFNTLQNCDDVTTASTFS